VNLFRVKVRDFTFCSVPTLRYYVFDLSTLHSSFYHIAQVVGLLGSSSFICTASGGRGP